MFDSLLTMEYYSDDEHDPISGHQESDLERLKRENFILRRKLLDQKREIDALRAEGHSTDEEKDPEMANMDINPALLGPKLARDPKRTLKAILDAERTRNRSPLAEPLTTETQPEPEPVEKLDPALVGMSPGLKHLYSGKEDRRGRYQWQTTIPKDVGRPAEDAETAKWALIVRHIKVSTCAS